MSKDLNELPVRVKQILERAEFTTEQQIIIFMGKNPRKLLKVPGVGMAAYKHVLTWLDNKTVNRCEHNYQVRNQQKKEAQKVWENMLALHIKSHKLKGYKTQYRFSQERLWTFDFAWPDKMLAVEIDGGLHIRGGGGHNSARGYTKDREKDQAAILEGWTVYRVTPQMVRKGEAINNLIIMLKAR